MRKLHHWTLDPFSRSIRIALAEKGLEAQLIETRPWSDDTTALKLNPLGGAPVMEEETPDGRLILAEPLAILGYLEDVYTDKPLLADTVVERAEARWVMGWLERGFDGDVNQTLLQERVMQRCLKAGTPNSRILRQGAAALGGYLRHVDAIAGVRPYLAGEQFSLADVCMAAHLSCHDYFGDVDWGQFPMAAIWYTRMKSRSSFRSLLKDRVSGVDPAPHYPDLDF